MSKMNEYPSVGDPQEFTQAEKAAFLGSAMCIATGPKNSATVTANIPFSDIRPTKLSDLTDDITVDTYNATSEAPISGKGVAVALGNFGGFQVAEKGQDGKPAVSGTIDPKAIYLTPSGESGTENAYDEWICTDTSVPTWEKVGVTRVDLSQYYTKTEANAAFVSSTGYIAVPPTDNVNNGYLLTKTANGVQWNEMDREHLLRDGAGITVYGTAGYPERVSVKYDSNTLSVNGSNELNVKLPVPPISGITDGYVLTKTTTNNADDVVWAAGGGGGGGSSLPAFTDNDLGKTIQINGVYETIHGQYGDYDELVGTELAWENVIPEIPGVNDVGSGGRLAQYPLIARGVQEPDGTYITKAAIGYIGCPMQSFILNPSAGDMYYIWEQDQYSSSYFTMKGTNAYCGISNAQIEFLKYLDSDCDSATCIELCLLRSGNQVPYAIVEFINEAGKDLPLIVTQRYKDDKGVEHTGSVDGEEIYYMHDISDNSSPVIPDGAFAHVEIKGHGFTVKLCDVPE